MGNTQITDVNERYKSGVIPYKKMGYWDPDHVIKETDVLAMFRMTSQAALKPTSALPPSPVNLQPRPGRWMADAKTPASFEYNVEITRRVCDMAHPVGVSVEGELGCLGSMETGEDDGSGAEGKLTHDMMLTDPVQAKDFVAKTGVDALAIAIGTNHGAYKFTRKPTGDILAMDRIEAIHAQISNTHLVMHGLSSVPQEWLEIIRKYGGDIKETYGVPAEEIQRGIKSGVRKINIDTDIRLAMTGAMRQVFAEQRSEFDPRKDLVAAKNAARSIFGARFEAFGCAGMGSRIKPITLDAMSARYA